MFTLIKVRVVFDGQLVDAEKKPLPIVRSYWMTSVNLDTLRLGLNARLNLVSTVETCVGTGSAHEPHWKSEQVTFVLSRILAVEEESIMPVEGDEPPLAW